MKREEVEALLAVSVAGNDQWADAMQHKLTRRMTRELCRAWLAVDGAEIAHVEPKNGLAVLHERCMPLSMQGKRVRLVPEVES